MKISSMHSFKDVAPGRRETSRGGAAVEFALVLPIFMLLVMGALDYGYFFFSDQVVAGAAREGARAGTMISFATGFPTAKGAAEQAARDYMNNNGIGCPGGGITCITVTNPTVSAGSLSMPAIQVVIQYPFTSLTGYSSIVLPANVRGQAVMRWPN